MILFAFFGPRRFLFLVRTEPALLKICSLGTEVAGMIRYLIAVCLFVCLEWRPGPRPRDRFRQRYPFKGLSRRQSLRRDLFPVLEASLVLRGIDREGGGEAPTKPPYDVAYVPASRVPRMGDGREVRGFPSSTSASPNLTPPRTVTQRL